MVFPGGAFGSGAADAVLRFSVDDQTGKGLGSIASGLRSAVVPAAALSGLLAGFSSLITSSIQQSFQAEQELRPMIQRAGIQAELLQRLTEVARQTGSEDPLEGITDFSQELALRLAEGTDSTREALQALGLDLDYLNNSLETQDERVLAVLAALQRYPDAMGRKFLADELAGGASEKLAGILNLTNDELQRAIDLAHETAVIYSGEQLESLQESQREIGKLTNEWSLLKAELSLGILPVITEVVTAINDLIDNLQEFFNITERIGGSLNVRALLGIAIPGATPTLGPTFLPLPEQAPIAQVPTGGPVAGGTTGMAGPSTSAPTIVINVPGGIVTEDAARYIADQVNEGLRQGQVRSR